MGMQILDGIYYLKSSASAPCGYFKYENNILEFYKYKQIEGRYDIVSYVVVKIIEMFRKDKLIFSAKKEDIKNLRIEKGQAYSGFGSSAINLLGGSTKTPDNFVITTNEGEFKFILREDKESRDSSEFNQYLANIGMSLS